MPIVFWGVLYELVGARSGGGILASGQRQKVGGNFGGNSVPLRVEFTYYFVGYVATSIPPLATIQISYLIKNEPDVKCPIKNRSSCKHESPVDYLHRIARGGGG
jgi:hypothetical protein